MYLIDIYQLDFIHKILRRILREIENEFGPGIITSLFRIGDSGVHGTLPLRGVDLRCRNRQIGTIITEWANARWQYDPNRPKKVVAEAHGEGSNYHIHMQVHPLTIRRSYVISRIYPAYRGHIQGV